MCLLSFSGEQPNCPLKSLHQFTLLLAADLSSSFPMSLLALTDFHLIFYSPVGVKCYIKCLIGIFLISSEAEQFSMFINYFICCFTCEILAHNFCAFRLSFVFWGFFFLLISGGYRYIHRYSDYRDRYSAII